MAVGRAGPCGHVRGLLRIPSVVGVPAGVILVGDTFRFKTPSAIVWSID